MCMKTKFYSILMCLALWASALSAQTHWSVNPHDYQYDMSVYYSLSNGETPVGNLSDYEVAAFVGNVCRGVGKVETQTGTNGTTLTYGFLKVYSNVASGETVTFKYYLNGQEKPISGQVISFVNLGLEGLPSNPHVFNLEVTYILGDVDGDGEITINDVIMTINASLGNPSAAFNAAAADLDGDGEITINDVIKIINLTLQN